MDIALEPTEGIQSSARYGRLEIAEIRTDGGTQGRVSLNQHIIDEYCILITGGVEFPPIRTRFDGTIYWLTDGFHRIAAAHRAGHQTILAEISNGSLSDAQWESYGSNAHHGLRRNRADLAVIIKRALEHPNGSNSSNNQLAKHLGVPEATLRRWRKQLSSSKDEDSCFASRRGTTYRIKTSKIGKSGLSPRREIKSRRDLKVHLIEMKNRASPRAQRILNTVSNWIFGGATFSECLAAIENIVGPR